MAISIPAPLDRKHWKHFASPRLFERLVARAHESLQNRFWGNGAIPDGSTAESIALDAIEDVLLGRAGWDPERDVDPYHCLSDIVASKISNLVWSFRNRNAVFLEADCEPGEVPSEFDKVLDDQAAEALHAKVLDVLRDEPDLVEYVNAAARIGKRAEIAARLSVSADEITNRQKRVRRVFATLLPQFIADGFIASDQYEKTSQ